MNYLYVQMNGHVYVCSQQAGEDVILNDASKSTGVKYSKIEIADEQKRVNTYLESIGQSNYQIEIAE